MVVTEVVNMFRQLPREEKTLALEQLSNELSADFSSEEIVEIKCSLAEADREFAQGKGLSANRFFADLNL